MFKKYLVVSMFLFGASLLCAGCGSCGTNHTHTSTNTSFTENLSEEQTQQLEQATASYKAELINIFGSEERANTYIRKSAKSSCCPK